jgi:hypothetical protein
MSMLVEQQDETINTIENQAGGVSTDMEAGYVLVVLVPLPRNVKTVGPLGRAC